MRKLKIGAKEISYICLGGAKMLEMSYSDGEKLLDKAVKLGINICDAHHRYGNCEEILGKYKDIFKMTKVSVYSFEERYVLVNQSVEKLGEIDIFWISDLDDMFLYNRGIQMFDEFKNTFTHIGITTESSELGFRFLRERPECQLFMVPLFIGREDMIDFIKVVQKIGKKVFTIKSFCDKLLFEKYSVRQCLDFVKIVKPDVVVLGTSNPNHLEECVRLYEG